MVYLVGMVIIYEYKSLKEHITYKYVQKHSIFLSMSCRVESKDMVEKFLSEEKSKYPDAKHHAYAYRLTHGQIFKTYDDGEPYGTAGIPILNAIDNVNLSNVLIVVSRYFGGTLLGRGGLIQAYYESASLSIKNNQISDLKLCKVFTISVGYDKFEKIKFLCSKYYAKILDIIYQHNVTITVCVDVHQFDELKNKILNILEYSIEICTQNDGFFEL